jgi:hypothetical protein
MTTPIVPTPEQYLAARIAEALATDERTNALDIEVSASATAIIVTGVVSCAARRQAVEEVISELLPEHVLLDNQLCIQKFQEPAGSEVVD